MLHLILKMYGALFGRRVFYRMNRLLYQLSLRGLGVLNHVSNKASGEHSFLKRYLSGREGGIVFDVGANVGGYSRTVLGMCPSVTLYAFEPHPKTFSVLKSHLEQENFIPVNAAAGDADGVMSLYDYASDDGTSHASLYRDVIENIHMKQSVEHKVEVVALGRFAKDRNIEKIDLLKVDTEGNELKVLLGISDYILAGKIEAIHFEFNEMNISSRTFFRDFWSLLPNYDLYRLLPDGMVLIDRYSPVFCEIFAYQNIVAILKRDRSQPF